ncbi:MAG: CYTH domain-containing protein, partial [Patescibacteria group bacterium]|nr:CYTH domain-containing protein [Patescibacteria group bacterium]
LGEALRAEELLKRMQALDGACVLVRSSEQLNHYFEGGDPAELAKRLAAHLSAADAARLAEIAKGSKVSVRTRAENGEARIVMKASIGDDSSENGVMRAEFEQSVPGFSLDALDSEVLAAGFRYQAKWSRAREEYALQGANVCLDKNAGYGYVAEFEKVIDDAARAPAARAELLGLMEGLGVEELPQDRLERMFAHYNAHWPEYYGTDKVFTVE